MRPKLLSGKNALLLLIALGIFSALAVWYRNGMPLPGRTIPSTAGKLAFISTRSGKSDVWLMDGADGKNATALTQDDATDSSPAFSPDGSEVAFVSSGRVGVTPQIFRMDALPGTKVLQVTNTSSTKYSPQYGPHDMLYYEDAGKLLGTNLKDNDTDALLPEADQRQAMAAYLSLGGFDQIKVSPDGSRYLAVMKVENHQVLTLYLPSDQALIFLGVAEKIFMDWKPDGGFTAVFARGAPSKPIPLLTPEMLQKGIPLPNLESFLPPTDDTYLATFDKDVNLVGNPEQAPLAPDAFALSPDGTKAAFVFGEGKKMHGVVLVPVGVGGEIKQLYHQPSDAPAWSPDSQQLAFVSGKDIFVVPASGGEPKNLTNGQGENTEPVWSPAKPKK